MEGLSSHWICVWNSIGERLQMAQKLPEPIYTPATKAEVGEHDENISYEKTVDLIGKNLPIE